MCGLVLARSDMVLTEIPFDIDLGKDEATPDEVDAWQDAQYEDAIARGYDPSDHHGLAESDEF